MTVGVIRIGLILLVFGSVLGAADEAERLYRAAQRAQRAGDSLQAYQLYAQAAALAPSKREYALQRSLLHDWASLAAQVSSTGDDADRAAQQVQLEGMSPSQTTAGRQASPAQAVRPRITTVSTRCRACPTGQWWRPRRWT